MMAGVCKFLTKKLRLKVNESKSAVARPDDRKFLGFRLTTGAEPQRLISPQALRRFEARVRGLTSVGAGTKTSGHEGTHRRIAATAAPGSVVSLGSEIANAMAAMLLTRLALSSSSNPGRPNLSSQTVLGQMPSRSAGPAPSSFVLTGIGTPGFDLNRGQHGTSTSFLPMTIPFENLVARLWNWHIAKRGRPAERRRLPKCKR